MLRLVATIALVGLVGAPGASRADEPSPADRALTHLQRGVAAFRAGNFDAALPDFEAARKLAPDKPNPYRWLALTLVQLGDCPAALVNIEAFLARVSAGDPRIAELERLGDLCRRTGVLRVRSDPSGANLRIDGAYVGTTPYQALSMRPGEHRVRVSKDGYRSREQTMAVVAGRRVELTVTLPRARTPITRRWWFWASVAATAVAVTAVGIAIADDDPTMLPPIHCGDAGCTTGAR